MFLLFKTRGQLLVIIYFLYLNNLSQDNIVHRTILQRNGEKIKIVIFTTSSAVMNGGKYFTTIDLLAT